MGKARLWGGWDEGHSEDGSALFKERMGAELCLPCEQKSLRFAWRSLPLPDFSRKIEGTSAHRVSCDGPCLTPMRQGGNISSLSVWTKYLAEKERGY